MVVYARTVVQFPYLETCGLVYGTRYQWKIPVQNTSTATTFADNPQRVSCVISVFPHTVVARSNTLANRLPTPTCPSSSPPVTSWALIDLFQRHIISFKGLPSRLHPFGLPFNIIFVILLLFILVTCRSQFDLNLLSCSSTISLRIPWILSKCLMTRNKADRQLLHEGELVKSCMPASPPPPPSQWFNSATLKMPQFTIVRFSNLTYLWMVNLLAPELFF